MGIGDWGCGNGPNPPTPHPQSPIPNPHIIVQFINIKNYNSFKYIN